ncbi:MAG: DsbA family protein [Vicinamibacteria bacterium]
MKQSFVLIAIALTGLACGQRGATAVVAASSPDTVSSAVAAKIGSKALSNAELDTRLKDDLKSLNERAAASEEQLKLQMEDLKRQIAEQQYNLRRKALTEMLFDMEAQSRGITRDALLAQEITAKSTVTPAEIDTLWEEVKPRAGKMTKEQALPQLQQMAAQRKTETRVNVFQRELFKKHNVSFVGLQPSRRNVTFPSDAPSIGPADAPVTIVEFTDYQCPYCQQAQQYVDRVMKAYEGKVRLVYQEFPLDFHAQAKPAGNAARCAGEQGKFWEMHTGVLRTPGAFDEADLKNRATALGIDANKFGACVAAQKYEATIQKSIENARSVGVSATPTFFVNGRSFSGAQPFEVFERIIEDELVLSPAKNARQ